MEADLSPGGSLGDPYDMAMAQMEAHMLETDDLHSLDAASERSDEELRIIMDPESRQGFVPVSPAVKVARGSAGGRQGSGGTRGSAATRGRVGAGDGRGAGRGKENKTRARPRKAHEVGTRLLFCKKVKYY